MGTLKKVGKTCVSELKCVRSLCVCSPFKVGWPLIRVA